MFMSSKTVLLVGSVPLIGYCLYRTFFSLRKLVKRCPDSPASSTAPNHLAIRSDSESLTRELELRGVECTEDGGMLIKTPEGMQDSTTAVYAALHHYRFENSIPASLNMSLLLPSHPEVDRKGHPFVNTLAVMRVPHLTRKIIRRMRHAIVGRPTIIVAFETRAMAFAAVLAYDMQCAFVPARKVDDTVGLEIVGGVIDDTQSYRDHSTIAIDGVLFVQGDKVLIVDDVMSSGATVRALKELILKCSASVEVIGEIALVNFAEPSKGILSY